MDIGTEKIRAPNRKNRVSSRGGGIIQMLELTLKAQLGGMVAGPVQIVSFIFKLHVHLHLEEEVVVVEVVVIVVGAVSCRGREEKKKD